MTDDGGWSMDGLLTLYLIVIYNSSEINVFIFLRSDWLLAGPVFYDPDLSAGFRTARNIITTTKSAEIILLTFSK